MYLVRLAVQEVLTGIHDTGKEPRYSIRRYVVGELCKLEAGHGWCSTPRVPIMFELTNFCFSKYTPSTGHPSGLQLSDNERNCEVIISIGGERAPFLAKAKFGRITWKRNIRNSTKQRDLSDLYIEDTVIRDLRPRKPPDNLNSSQKKPGIAVSISGFKHRNFLSEVALLQQPLKFELGGLIGRGARSTYALHVASTDMIFVKGFNSPRLTSSWNKDYLFLSIPSILRALSIGQPLYLSV
ncbi:hypothetical protein C8R43DRAFT_958848 [Mycena crocata]|nr:hypothetical protein C8R43DRAFT_958848 [Mycena crocata]